MGSLSGVKMSLIRDLERDALEKYRECPKYVTIVSHADLQDDSEFHCILFDSFVGPVIPGSPKLFQRNFFVPGQEIILVEDDIYGLFSLTKVFEYEDGPKYWLVASVRSRMGFLIPFDCIPKELVVLEEVIA